MSDKCSHYHPEQNLTCGIGYMCCVDGNASECTRLKELSKFCGYYAIIDSTELCAYGTSTIVCTCGGDPTKCNHNRGAGLTPEAVEQVHITTNASSYDSLLDYANAVEREYLNGEHKNQTLDIILACMLTLYRAAYNIGEITWEEMLQMYADFTMKILNLR